MNRYKNLRNIPEKDYKEQLQKIKENNIVWKLYTNLLYYIIE